MPIVIIVLLYPFTLITRRFAVLYSGLVILLIYGCLNFPLPIENIVTKPEAARDVWEYLADNYDGKTPVLLGYSLNTNLYYHKEQISARRDNAGKTFYERTAG